MNLRILPRFLLLVILPTVLCLCAIVSLSDYKARSAMTEEISLEMRKIVELQASELYNIYTLLGGVARDFAESGTVLRMLDPATPGEERPTYAMLARKGAMNLLDIFSYGGFNLQVQHPQG